jgi:hypothetical protein
MKKLIRLLVLTALVATFALPALAQTPTTPSSSATTTPASGQDDAEAKRLLYEKFTGNRNTNPAVAYEAGKEYLQKYEATDGPNDQYVSYIKKWLAAYDKVARRNQLIEQLKNKNYNVAFSGARPVLADYPEDLGLLYELSKAGLFAAIGGNETNNAAAVEYAKKSLQMIQAGKTFEKDKPLPNRDENVGLLNYALGFLLRQSQPAEAATYLINAAQAESFKKDPNTYSLLAAAYEQSEYATLRNQYEANCKTEEQLKGAQCVELTAKVNNVLDRMIDALARAVAYSKSSPDAARFEQARTGWMEQLTALYKYRNNGSDAGLNELIAGVTAKPIPKPGQTPAATPQTTPASNTTAPTPPSGTPGDTSSNTSTTTAKPGSTTAPATTTAQPATKTTSTKTTP